MKKEIKKLSLKKETIVALNNNSMSQVLGGGAKGTLVPERPTAPAAARGTLETTVVGYLTIYTVA